jgi:predicted transcriptional regulator
MTHEELKKTALARAEVKAAYDDLAPEYALLKRMISARRKLGLTQADVARRMGISSPAVARLESSLLRGTHSPSLSTIGRYAEAVGCRVDVRLVAVS